MRNLTKKRNSTKLALAAFTLTAGVLCAVFACFGLFPFGGKTLAWGDMKQQVIPLMLEFKDILAGESGFLLNLQNAGGMSFWGVFFFFLSSPFTFLVAFIEKGDVYYLVNVLVLLKLALSAASASFFFGEEQPELDGKAHLFLCCSYAMCGYGMLYYQNLVWLDMLCLFPLLMLGFRRLVFERKCVLFTVCLCGAVTVNYYLSYMVFLALILCSFLFIRFCEPKRERGETAGRIGLCALLALLITAVVWLPSLLQCLHSARTSQGIVGTVADGSLFTEIFTALPVLFCTAGALALPALAMPFPKNQKRKALLWLLFLMCLPVILEPVNKLFHTGSYQAFPVRYGYIPVFLTLWYIADLWRERSAPRAKRQIGWLFLPLCVALLASAAWLICTRWEQITVYVGTLWLSREAFFLLLTFSVLAAGIVFLALYLRKKGKVGERAAGWALLFTSLLQGALCAAVFMGPAAYAPERGRAVLKMEDTLSDAGLYRVKQEEKFCDVNLLGAAGFPTLNHYTSLTDEEFLHAMKKLGYSSYWMETSACCGTRLSDILLSNKYTLSGNLEWKETGGGNLGYLLPAGILSEKLWEGDRFQAQNELYSVITSDKGNAFTRSEPTDVQGVTRIEENDELTLEKVKDKAILVYEIGVGPRETLYFDAFGENTNRLREKINEAFRVTVNGGVIAETYPTQRCNGILKLGEFEREHVTVTVELLRSVEGLRSFGIVGLREDKVLSFRGDFQQAELSVKGSRISGSAEAREGEALFLSIPFNEGLRCKVNGKTVTPRIVLDCFLELPLEKGMNTIEITCLPQGITTGAVLSALGLISVVPLLVFRGRGKKLKALWQKAAWPLLIFCFSLVVLLVYFLPALIWLVC